MCPVLFKTCLYARAADDYFRGARTFPKRRQRGYTGYPQYPCRLDACRKLANRQGLVKRPSGLTVMGSRNGCNANGMTRKSLRIDGFEITVPRAETDDRQDDDQADKCRRDAEQKTADDNRKLH